MFVVQRNVSRAEKWFRVFMLIMLLPLAAATMHWAVNPKSPPKQK
jgi:hypothetical protein